jgi:hypothetical protein
LTPTSGANITGQDFSDATPFLTVDNGRPGYNETGAGWQTLNQGWNGTSRTHAADGSGNVKASWTFTQKHGLPAGSYEVFVTYVSGSGRDPTSTYQVFDGAFLQDTVSVDQTTLATDGLYQGSGWKSLGVFTCAHGRLVVRLSVEAAGSVDADGALIVAAGLEKDVPLQFTVSAYPSTGPTGIGIWNAQLIREAAAIPPQSPPRITVAVLSDSSKPVTLHSDNNLGQTTRWLEVSRARRLHLAARDVLFNDWNGLTNGLPFNDRMLYPEGQEVL